MCNESSPSRIAKILLSVNCHLTARSSLPCTVHDDAVCSTMMQHDDVVRRCLYVRTYAKADIEPKNGCDLVVEGIFATFFRLSPDLPSLFQQTKDSRESESFIAVTCQRVGAVRRSETHGCPQNDFSMRLRLSGQNLQKNRHRRKLVMSWSRRCRFAARGWQSPTAQKMEMPTLRGASAFRVIRAASRGRSFS